MDPISIALVISALINATLLRAWWKQRFINLHRLDDLENQLLCLTAKYLRAFNARIIECDSTENEDEKETERAHVD